MDSLVENFSTQACDRSNLLAMTMGGLSFRIARVGFLSLFSSLPSLVRLPLVATLSLGIEVGAFRGVHHFSNPAQENYWNPQGWARESINFACLKGMGEYFRSSNPLLRHVSQNFAMMFGEEAGSHFHLTPEIQGNFAERFVHASALNLALGTGHSFSEILSGGLTLHLERNILSREVYGSDSPLFTGNLEILSMASNQRLNKVRLPSSDHQKILEAFRHPTESLYGLEVTERTGLGQGSCYPNLRELEAEGFLVSREVTVVPGIRGGRPRRYYELTHKGRVFYHFRQTFRTLSPDAQQMEETEISHLYAILYPNHRPDFQFSDLTLHKLFTWGLIQTPALRSKMPYEISEKGRTIIEGLVLLDYF